MKNDLLVKKGLKTIHGLIKQRSLENFEVIVQTERIIRERRKFVIKLPPAGSPVVLLVSGGLDSIITWGLLLQIYKFKVYPLFLRGQLPRSKNERKSVKFFEKYYQNLFPSLSQPVYEMTINLFPKEVRQATKSPFKYYHPLSLLDISVSHGGNIPIEKSPSRTIPALMPLYAQFYAQYLEDHSALKVRTIFNGIMTGDGTVLSTQSLTAQRTAMLNLCSITHDYSWQWISLSMEPALGFWFEKSDFIKMASRLKIPIEKTWSCFKNGSHHCGDSCIACVSRRKEFHQAKIKDRTVYAHNLFKEICHQVKTCLIFLQVKLLTIQGKK